MYPESILKGSIDRWQAARRQWKRCIIAEGINPKPRGRGDIPRRARFVLNVVNAMIGAVDADKVAVKVAPRFPLSRYA